MSDLKLIENGDGGDFILHGSDLVIIDGFENMPYLGMFGGNVEANTEEVNLSELRFDWWGNSVFLSSDSTIQFNSNLQRLLKNIPITTQTRVEIEEVIKDDLDFMNVFSEVSVTVSIISVDKIRINVIILEPGNPQSTEFVYIWDSTLSELSSGVDSSSQYGNGIMLNCLLDFEL